MPAGSMCRYVLVLVWDTRSRFYCRRKLHEWVLCPFRFALIFFCLVDVPACIVGLVGDDMSCVASLMYYCMCCCSENNLQGNVKRGLAIVNAGGKKAQRERIRKASWSSGIEHAHGHPGRTIKVFEGHLLCSTVVSMHFCNVDRL